MNRRKFGVARGDFAPLVQASERVCGAEIEQAVVSALCAALLADEPMCAKRVL